MTTTPDLTPDQLAYIRAAAARWRMDEAGPMMLEALRKAERELVASSCILYSIQGMTAERSRCLAALESVRAAIAAAE